MRVWTIMYDEHDHEALPSFALLGGEADVAALLDLLARLARAGHLSLLVAQASATPPPPPPGDTVA